MAKKVINEHPIEGQTNEVIEAKPVKKEKESRLSNAEIMEFVKELSDMVEKEYNLRKREGTVVINGKKTNHMDLDQTRIGLKRSYAVLFELTGRQSRIG